MSHQRFARALICASALLIAPQSITFAQDGTADPKMLEAQRFIEEGDLRSAFVTLLDAAQSAPESVEIRQLLATTALELADFGRAEKEIERAMQLGLPEPDGWLVLVRAAFGRGDMDRVISLVVQMPVQASPAVRAELLGLRGYAEAAQDSLQRAKRTLDQALSLDALNLHALLGRALVDGRRGDQDGARRWIDQAIDGHPDAADAWSLLGDLEMSEGNFDAATDAFARAVDLRPATTLERARLALALTQLERFDEAEAELSVISDRALAAHPYTQYVKGRVAFAQQRYEAAAEAFGSCYSAMPNFLANRLYLAATDILLDNDEQAMEHVTFVASRTASEPRAERLSGGIVTTQPRKGISVDASQYPVVEEVLLEAVVHDPANAPLLQLLASLALLQGKSTEAETFFARMRESQLTDPTVMSLAEAIEPPPNAQTDLGDYHRRLLAVVGAIQQGPSSSGTLPGNGEAPTNADDLIEQALALKTDHPGEPEPINLLAAAYLVTGRGDLAREELQNSLAIDRNQPDVTRNLAQLEALSGNLRNARALLVQLDLRDLGSQGALLLHDLETKLGNSAEGLALLERVLEAHPEAAEVRAKLAEAALQVGQLDRVLELTEDRGDTEITLVPELLRLRGTAQLAAGDAQGATETFTRWVRSHPDSAEAQFQLAESLARAGDPGSHDAIQRAIELDRAYLPARLGQIKSLVRRDALSEADEAIDALYRDFGERPSVQAMEGWYAFTTGDYERAQRSLSAALEAGRNSETVRLLSRTLWEQQAYADSITTLGEYLEQHPTDLDSLMMLAGAYLALEQPDDARRVYEHVVTVYPNHIPALNNVAWLSRDQDLDAAIDYARQAHALQPENATASDTLGKLLVLRGDKDEGIAILESALKAHPDDIGLRTSLEQALAKPAPN